MNSSEVLEAKMLVCFGLAWPIATLKMLRSGGAEGRGISFTLTILCGYLAGTLSKLLSHSSGIGLPPVFWMYLLNSLSVGANLVLQWHFRRRPVIGNALVVVA